MNPSFASSILASLRCGVVAVDPGGTVTLVNGPAADALAVAPGTWYGRSCRTVFAHCPAFATLLMDALTRETLPDRAELEIEVGPARRLLLGFSLSRISGDNDEIKGSVIFFKDLTFVEEERERQALHNRLAALGEVAAQLAHELRNRLGGVRLFVGLARRRAAGDAESVGYLDRAEQELLSANDKMSQVLDFVRPLKLEIQLLDVEPLCRAALEATIARYPGVEMEASWDVEAGLPAVLVDEARFRDALANLFANAVEATEGFGRITVRIRRTEAAAPLAAVAASIPGLRVWDKNGGTRVRIEISDNGPGMAPEVLRRIFQPFYTTKEDGSGLGVPAAQKIMDAHGGSLDVRSAPGRGATFTILIPAASEEKSHG